MNVGEPIVVESLEVRLVNSDRLALKARSQSTQRHVRERQVANMRKSDTAAPTDPHLHAEVHAEIVVQRLEACACHDRPELAT